jgi:hypothetical protein
MEQGFSKTSTFKKSFFFGKTIRDVILDQFFIEKNKKIISPKKNKTITKIASKKSFF